MAFMYWHAKTHGKRSPLRNYSNKEELKEKESYTINIGVVMKTLFILTIISILLVSLESSAQRFKKKYVLNDTRRCWDTSNAGSIVQWASSVIDFSSQYDTLQYSARQILGKPSVMPQGGKSPCSWAPADLNYEDFIKVRFDNSMRVRQIVIAINHVTEFGLFPDVYLYDEENNKYLVSINLARYFKGGWMDQIILDSLTTYKVKSVEIVIYNEKSNYENLIQIDAIGISDSEIPVEAKINITDVIKFIGEPENLGRNVNSKYIEGVPVITPDGKTLFFARKKHPDNIGEEKRSDIWICRLDSIGNWLTGNNIGKPLNNKNHNWICSVTPDNNKLLLGGTYGHGQGCSMSHKIQSGWSLPKKVEIENYYNRNKYSDFYLSNDNKTLLMGIERDDSFGDKDLYVSFIQEDDTWSEPLNLGNEINTASNDGCPFLASDDKTLFFTSAGFPGYGKSDIFMSKRLDDSWQNWSEPENLGGIINSDKSDGYFTIPASGKYAYFSSNENSYGKGDIFRLKMKMLADNILVYGKVYNRKTNEQITEIIVKIRYERLSDGKEVGIARTDPNTGEYKITLPFGQKYAFRAEAEDLCEFWGISENEDLRDSTLREYQEKERDLYLVPIEIGQRFPMNVFFDFGKYDLRKESYPDLKRAAEMLRECPTLVIEIAGHTDNVGRPDSNMVLSKNRANSVRSFLISQSIDEKRMGAKGYGEDQPVASNKTEKGRQKNRRVEFIIIKK